MTAILVLIGIGVVIVAAIVLVAVPVKHADGVAKDFYWRRSVHIGTRAWVMRKSKRRPRSSADVRNVEVHNADEADKLHHTYEQRVWRNMRTVPTSGHGQESVRDPLYTLGKDEAVRRSSALYQATFVSETGTRYDAKVKFARWKSLTKGKNYRLGRNTFGRVRTITPGRPPVKKRPVKRSPVTKNPQAG